LRIIDPRSALAFPWWAAFDLNSLFRARGKRLLERLAGGFEDGIPAGEPLPAAYGDIDVARFDLDAESAAADLFGCRRRQMRQE
jgi:hypothetical protein